MPTKLQVIQYPIQLPVDGIAPHEFFPLCVAIENHLKNVRLPDYLHPLKIRIEARLIDVERQCTLMLILWHDGQLPLNFAVSAKERRPAPELTKELAHLKETIWAALDKSKGVFAEVANIFNECENPAEDVANFLATTGFHAPRKPANKHVPSPMSVFAAGKQLTLEANETRPEYQETHAQIFSVLVSVGTQGMMFKVQSFKNEDPDSDFLSQTKVGQDLRPRWPTNKTLDCYHYAGFAIALEVPVVITGFAVVSTDTLAVKALQVKCFDVDRSVITRVLDTVKYVKNLETGQ